jgi:hypothetical protein
MVRDVVLTTQATASFPCWCVEPRLPSDQRELVTLCETNDTKHQT